MSTGTLTDGADSIDLVGIGRLLWSHKFLIALSSILCGLVAVVVALTSTPIYRAEVVVTAAHDTGASGGGLGGQFGAIQSLVGANLSAATYEEQEADAVLESHHLAEEFIERNGLQSELLRNSKPSRSLWFAVRRFKAAVLTIHKDVRKGLTTVDIEWPDPIIAARWANGFVALANELIRVRAVDDANRNIAYLTRQIAQTDVVELRQTLYDIIKNQTKTLMLASGRQEYAFEIVDPAIPPEMRDRPKRTAIVLIGLAVGALLGVVVAFARERTQLGKRRLVQRNPSRSLSPDTQS